MAKFVKKQIVVDAVRLDRNFFGGALHFVDGTVIAGFNNGEFPEDDCYINIKTLEGTMTAMEGDWIIKGVRGEFYPCKPDIFEETYQPEGNDFQYQFQQRQIKDAYLRGRQDATDEHQTRYHELIYAVETKHKNETRHQTALRYIQEKEHGNQDTSSSCLTSKMIDTMKDFLKDEKVIVVDLKK